MLLTRSQFVIARRRFGRRPVWIAAEPPGARAQSLGDDCKLFATTFAAGFLFVSLLIA